MPVRKRGQKWEWRFKINGHEWSQITDLDATEPNLIKAQRLEANARRLVLEGRGDELRISVHPFSSAADSFLTWAEGEYREHPNTWKRLRGSMASAKLCFGKKPLSAITRGALEDYKSLRRLTHKVREVTVRHDIHALSLLFQYGMKHGWCVRNPVKGIKIPSDKEAVRINVLSTEREHAYFTNCEALAMEASKPKRARGFRDLADLHKLMLLQGCRPEELRALEWANVDLEHGEFTITKGKSDAARRTLKLRAESRSILARRAGRTKEERGARWVFPGTKGGHMGSHQRLHAAVLKRSGVSCVPYDFRHTFATRAVERGIDLPTLAAILGHGNLRSVMKYVHMTKTHMDDAFARLDAILPAVCPLEIGKTGEESGKGGKSENKVKTQ